MSIDGRHPLNSRDDTVSGVNLKVGTMPYSSRITSRVLYTAQYHKASIAHSRPLNSLEHCIFTTSMTNIRSDRDSNPVPLSFDPKPVRMSRLVSKNDLSVWSQVKAGPPLLLLSHNWADVMLMLLGSWVHAKITRAKYSAWYEWDTCGNVT